MPLKSVFSKIIVLVTILLKFLVLHIVLATGEGAIVHLTQMGPGLGLNHLAYLRLRKLELMVAPVLGTAVVEEYIADVDLSLIGTLQKDA